MVTVVIEVYHYKFSIRQDIYTFLTTNKKSYKDIPFDLEGKIISSFEYISKIKNIKFWMGI